MKNLVIIPAYNEEGCIGSVVESLQQLPEGFELLVINDGSTDSTGRTAEELARRSRLPMRVLHLEENCGIGVAVQTGYMYAVADGGFRYVIQFDADGQHDAASVVDLTRACDDHALDLCVGSRFLETLPDGFRSTLLRRVGIRFFCGLLGLLSGVRVTDPTSGLRCAAPVVWRRFAWHYPDDYPEPESLFWCLRNRMRIGEIPVRMHSRESGESSIRRVASVYYMTKVTLAVIIDRLRTEEHAVDER